MGQLLGEGKNGSCQGYVFAGTFGLLLRQTSLGVNFCARHRSNGGAKPQKFPYALLKHNLVTHFYPRLVTDYNYF